MKTIGIFADLPTASTGFAVVCSNLANELSRDFRVIYFGRFGRSKEFALESEPHPQFIFEYVPCQGGVWDKELCVRILKHYDEVDYVFSEDDWFSMYGLAGACNFWDKPLHLLTPIDSLPVSPLAFEIFTFCDKIYVPNSSYALYNNKKRLRFSDKVSQRAGDHLRSVFLPHGVSTDIFRPMRVDRPEEFTFYWSGRAEQRKSPGRAVLAFEKIHDKMDATMYMRSDWTTPNGKRLFNYIVRKDLPIIIDQTQDVPHGEMAKYYNMGDVNICSSKAGGFEMGVTEAAACGIPSIVTDWNFMNENIVDGKTGYLVPTESFEYPRQVGHARRALHRIWGNISIDLLAETMYHCYLNQEEVKTMGRFARDYVTENYKWKDVANILAKEIRG